MPTPVELLSEFQVNTGSAAIGEQLAPKIIGLSNGNFLVAWVEQADGAIATTAGADIVGKIYDSNGNVVQDAFRLNDARSLDDELDFDLAATNDGGFVLVYTDDDTADTTQESIHVERFDASGAVLFSSLVVSETGADDFLEIPSVTVDLTTNDAVVTYTRPFNTDGTDLDVFGHSVSSLGVVSARFSAGQNSSGNEQIQDVAVLSDGNVASAYLAADGVIAIRITSQTGTAINTFISGLVPVLAAVDIAGLADGGMVVVAGGDFRVFDSAGAALTPITSFGDTADQRLVPSVVALPDGGFAIIWGNSSDGTYEAQAFTALGAPDGAIVQIDDTIETFPDASVTADGRLLFTWSDSSQEIKAAIWDPRGDTIDMADFNRGLPNVLETNTVISRAAATTVTGTDDADSILGGDGADLIYGGGDNDELDGGSSDDTIFAGGGNDTLIAGFGSDTFDGGTGNDTFDIARADFDGQTFGFNLNLDAGNDQFDNEYVSIENVIGGDGDDSLTGTDGANTLLGGAGNDTIDGGFGGDSLDGGLGDNDTLSYAASSRVIVNLGQNIFLLGDASGDSVTGFENVIGSSDFDNLIGDDNDNSLFGGSDADVFGSSGGVDAFFGGTGNDIFQIISTENPNGVTYDGGADTDTIAAFFGSGNLFDFTGNTTLTDVETLALSGLSANSTVFLNKSNFISSLDRITVTPHDGFSIRLELFLSEAELDLSGVTFEGFDQPGDLFAIAPVGGGSRSIAATSLDDAITTFGSSDTIRAGDGADTISTQGGDDVIYAGISSGDPSEFDVIYGGNGSDTYFATDAAGTNALFVDDGGPAGDRDIVDLSGSSSGFSMFGDGLVTAATGARVEYTDIDLLILTDFSDTVQALRIGDLAEGVDLGAGNDRFTDFGGALLPGQTVDGGAGIDTVSAQQGLAVDVELGTASGLLCFERLVGSTADDTLTGDATADTTILGRGGDDTISGGQGSNVLYGGDDDDLILESGNDLVFGGIGDDTIQSFFGDDLIYGGEDDDVLVESNTGGSFDFFGGAGIDTVRTSGSFSDSVIYDLAAGIRFIGADDDSTLDGVENVEAGGSARVFGDEFANTLSGIGTSNQDGNQIRGGGGDDVIYGGSGNDTLEGEGGKNLIYGGDDEDQIQTGIGNDDIFAGEGDDFLFLIEVQDRATTINGGTDFDTLTLVAFSEGWTLDSFETARSGTATVTFSEVESLIGSDLADVIETQFAFTSGINTGAGNDIFNNYPGFRFTGQVLDGGADFDILRAGGNQGVEIGLGINDFDKQILNFEQLEGTEFGDILTGDESGTTIFGLGGNDTILGEGGNSTLTGDTVIDLGLGDDTGDGGAGIDTLSFGSLAAPGFVFGDIEVGVIVDLSAQGTAQQT
ncbi:MAG: beta strand repeat-containing protein, partial [Paracoccaceae bacterium]